jgi:hypothetical protein
MVDDHPVCQIGELAVQAIDDLLTPERNLLVQSAVIAGARRFVGSYGGFAYLAPSYGIPTHSYYSEQDRFARCHLQLAQAALGVDLLRAEPV